MIAGQRLVWLTHVLAVWQEMLAIMKSIYDMMGQYTSPRLRDDTPVQHVEKFFQVDLPHAVQGSIWQCAVHTRAPPLHNVWYHDTHISIPAPYRLSPTV